MAFTKLVTCTWALPATGALDADINQLYTDNIANPRDTYLAEQVAAGKTDGVLTEVSTTVFTRQWADQESAESWKSFIENLYSRVSWVAPPAIVITDL